MLCRVILPKCIALRLAVAEMLLWSLDTTRYRLCAEIKKTSEDPGAHLSIALQTYYLGSLAAIMPSNAWYFVHVATVHFLTRSALLALLLQGLAQRSWEGAASGASPI